MRFKYVNNYSSIVTFFYAKVKWKKRADKEGKREFFDQNNLKNRP